MIRRRALGAIVVHVVYFGSWGLIGDHGHDVIERWATLAAMAIAGVFYVGMVAAFLWARKSALNAAFAIQKAYWAALVVLLAVPLQGGIAFGHAPYARITIPYAWWTVPGWVRTYIWLGIAISTIGVAYEFFRANALWPFRRRGGEDTVVSERPSPPRDELAVTR